MELLCKKDDVYVGYGGAGVANRPEGKGHEWLATHCWICGRSAEEIKSDPYGSNRVETPIDRYITTHTSKPRGGVVKDYAFNRKSFDAGEIHNPDQGMIYTGVDGIYVTLEQDFRDEELAHFFSYAINATRGIDPRNPPDATDWEEMMKGGLQTALKRINIAFAVYGASRTATHQIVRSTRANFHQQSQRAHYYGDRPSVRMPESFLGKEGHGPEVSNLGDPTLADAFARLAEHSAAVYRLATDSDISYQDARFALLEGTTNFILCEYSLDEFINVYAYRGCSMFQWEIVQIVRTMRKVLIDAHPWLEPYIKISCEKTKGALDSVGSILEGVEVKESTESVAHHCTFQGWEEVEGQCDFPWARETNRSFRSERHGITRKRETRAEFVQRVTEEAIGRPVLKKMEGETDEEYAHRLTGGDPGKMDRLRVRPDLQGEPSEVDADREKDRANAERLDATKDRAMDSAEDPMTKAKRALGAQED